MSATPTPDERTRYSSRRADQVEIQAWPEFDEEGRGLLESVGDVIRPEPGEMLWDAGDAYDLYLVLAGGVCLVDRRGDRVRFVVEAGDFVGELGMLMGQPAFLAGLAMAHTTLLRVRVMDLNRLVATSTELSDVLLSAFDARRRLLTRWGEGGLVLADDDDRDMTQPTTRDLAAAVGLDLSGLPDQAPCDLLIVGAGPAGLAAAVYGASEGLDVVIAEGVALGGAACRPRARPHSA